MVFNDLILPLSQYLDKYLIATFALQVCNSLKNESNNNDENNEEKISIIKSLKTQFEKELSLTNPTASTPSSSLIITQNKPSPFFDAMLLLDAILAYYYVINGKIFESLDLLLHIEHQIDTSSKVIHQLTHFQLHKAFAIVEQKRGQYFKEFNHKLFMLSFSSSSSISERDEKAFSDILTFSTQDKIDISTDISLSALLSDQIYNFGEVLSYETVIKHTPDYIKTLLHVFQNGNLEQFLDIFTNQISTNAATSGNDESKNKLEKNKPFLYRKLQVIALLNYVFDKPAPERTFTFEKLINILKIDSELELLNIIIYAFGVKVLKGEINGVEKLVTFSWIQPRFLNKEQLSSLRNSVERSVGLTTNVIENVFGGLHQIDQTVDELSPQQQEQQQGEEQEVA